MPISIQEGKFARMLPLPKIWMILDKWISDKFEEKSS